MNECLYNCRSDKAVGYCKYHHCGVTSRQLRCKNCLQKECHYLVKYEDCWYWKQREIMKNKRKARKNNINIYVEKVMNGGNNE